MAGIIKKNKSAYGKRRKKKPKTYVAYMAAMAAPDEAAVDVDVNPYNLLISCFIYIRPVHAIRLYTTMIENAPPHSANTYIPSISCNLILLIIHYHKKNLPLLSDSILLTNQLFHLHLICTFPPVNYYYRV